MSLILRLIYNRRTNRLRGFLFGIAIGEALKGPYKNTIPKMIKVLEKIGPSRNIEIHQSNKHVIGVWSTSTYQFMVGASTMVDLKKCCDDGTELFNESFLKDRLASASDGFADKLGALPVSLDCKPNQIQFLAASAVLISQNSHMDTSQLITFLTRMVNTFRHRPIDIFPAIELIYLMSSIFHCSETIPDVYGELKHFMKRSRLRLKHNFQEYEQCRLQPMNKIDPDSGLWLLRNVSDILGVAPGHKWSDVPDFLPGLLKVKNESPHPDAAGALAGLILGGYAGYAGLKNRTNSESSCYDRIPDELIRNLWNTQIIEDLAGDICTSFGCGSMTIGTRNPRPKQGRKYKKQPRLEPILVYNSSKELPCAFLTLIVKNKSLQKKYPGGVRAYVSKHGSLVNQHISIMCCMSDYFQEVMQDLQEHGLSDDDYTFIDFGSFLMVSLFYDMEKKDGGTIKSKEEWIEEYMNLGVVSWLHIKERKNRYYVSFVEGFSKEDKGREVL